MSCYLKKLFINQRYFCPTDLATVKKRLCWYRGQVKCIKGVSGWIAETCCLKGSVIDMCRAHADGTDISNVWC